MSNPFVKAQRSGIWVRAAIVGPTGSGKSLTSLYIASGLSDRIAVIDTERGSARRYADAIEFDTLELESFSPERYIDAIRAAEEAGYKCLVVDSLSHAWSGKDGVLEYVDKAAARGDGREGNKWAGWRNATPMHNRLVDALLGFEGHLIITMRSKMEYVQEKDERGKTVIKKVGMQPIQRDGMEYEFDFVADMDTAHMMHVSKFRCEPGSEWMELVDANIDRPSASIGTMLKRWAGGEPMRKAKPPADPVPQPPPPGQDWGQGDEPPPQDRPAPKPSPPREADNDDLSGALEELGWLFQKIDGKFRTAAEIRKQVNLRAVKMQVTPLAAMLKLRDDAEKKIKELNSKPEEINA